LTVLDGELDSDTESLPVAGSLGDVFTDPVWVSEEKVYGGAAESLLLWRQTQRTDLGSEGG